MSDIRQGVSPTANHVLDLAAAIHAQRGQGLNSQLTLRALPIRAKTMADFAVCPAATLASRRDDAVHAAANLIAFAELADAELAKADAA